MKNRGFQEVYQLDGGIATYGEAYGDDGLWKGSLYVFDDRITMDFSDHAALSARATCAARPPTTSPTAVTSSCVRQMVRCAGCLGDEQMCERHTAALI